MGKGDALARVRNGADCGNIRHDTANVHRDAGGRNDAVRDLINEGLLVAGGIEAVHEVEFHRRAGGVNRLAEGLDLVGITGLEADRHLRNVELCFERRERFDDLRGKGPHEVAVRAQKRLALSAVDDEMLDLTLILHMCRKSGTAAADDARLKNLINDAHSSMLAFSRSISRESMIPTIVASIGQASEPTAFRAVLPVTTST